MRLLVLLLAALALAGCATPAVPGTPSATGTGSKGTSTSDAVGVDPARTPDGSVWLVAETGNLTLDGPVGAPNPACSRIAPNGHVDAGQHRVLVASEATLPAAGAILFVDPNLSWAYPGMCGGDQLFAVAAPGGNQTHRDGRTALTLRTQDGRVWLDGAAMADGQSVAKVVDETWSDGAGSHHLHGVVRYTATAGWHVARAQPNPGSGLDAYWGSPLRFQ